ncbi:MAG: FAD-dependent oxidoreductase [Geobacteraceae bacterium]|nr:FAD-dependent oxidoreductase [Geobacteraceae bacterium]
MAKYLIVGGVAAGMSAATRLRRLDETVEIIVFERGEYVSYANCGLPYYIGDTIPERQSLLIQTPEGFRNWFNIQVRIRNEVLSVHPVEKSIRVKDLRSGRVYEETYDKLLLTPGSSPVKPDIPGSDYPAVHALWTIPDSDRIRAMVDAGKVRRALVVGAGFLGLEMVENLHARGLRVTVVEMAKQAMSVLDFEIAAIIQRELALHKVRLLVGEGVAAFEPAADGGVAAHLSGGRTVEADLVLLSIGVKPNTGFIADSGIELGPRGHIIVDDYLRTSNEHIYAAGDAIEVTHPLTLKKTAIPLAGPANKQGRIVAGNMLGRMPRPYKGTMGTAIAKVFNLTVGMTGASEKLCKANNIPCSSVIIHHNDIAGYYPGAMKMCLKLIFSSETRKVLGAQAAGYSGIDKRIDVIATAIKGNMTVDDLAEIEHAYAPPYSSAKDPVNIAGFMAQDILDGLVCAATWEEVEAADKVKAFLLDVCTPAEFALCGIPGAVNIPLSELRDRIGEIPRDRKVIVYCTVGQRSYYAARILAAHGFKNVSNLSGGCETWQAVTGSRRRHEKDSTQVWSCSSCGRELSLMKVGFAYMTGDFEIDLPACGACGLVLVPESLAMGKMAEVERILEDK